MLEIKLYSTGTLTSSYIQEEAQRQLQQADIDFNWNEVKDVEVFLADKVKSVPALKIQDKFYYFNQSGILKTHLENIIQSIIETVS